MRSYFGVILIILSFSAYSQSANEIQWSKNDSTFYTIEQNSIIDNRLPDFDKSIFISSSQLVPAGKNEAISIESFSLSDDGQKVLIFTNGKKVWRRNTRGDYWVINKSNKKLFQIGKGKPASSLMFAKFSPDGLKVAYVSGHNLYVEDLASNKITRLTRDGTSRLINGTFDWAYEEEFDCRDGFRWSEDSKNIAYWQIDARQIKNFLLINNTDSLYSFSIPVEYPKVGENPSAARVGVVNVATAKTTWMNLPGDPWQHYIPRMEWAANKTQLILEQLNRKQNEAKIFLCNIANGVSTSIYIERDKAWIDIKSRWSEDPTGWEWINNGKEFLWMSEKDGWRHLYRLDRNGKEKKITTGNYDVISLEAIDNRNGIAYFLASPNNATQKFLYRINLRGDAQAERLSPENQAGTHVYNISPTAGYSIHNYSNIKGEWLSEWVTLPNHTSFATIGKSAIATSGTKPLPEMFQITTEDNVTMDGWMIKPLHFDSLKKYPVLFQVYSEPASTIVKDARGSAGTFLYAGDMAADGYIQIGLDGRGTPAPKGADWRKAIYRKIGIVNVRDQAMAAKKISAWPFVDTSRIAVWGWSGGGSTTLNLLFQYPNIYKTGISIAPVANQLLYDNIYQERYMGLPQEDMKPFIEGSPVTHAKNLRGNLLVIHGTGDDNVHYQGTEVLINELVKHGKNFQMMSYPNRTHSISEGEGTRRHLANLFTSYLNEHCPAGPK